MYMLQTVDLGTIAGAQSQPIALGVPICAVMVIAAPTGFVATIQDAQTQQAIPLPPAGQGFRFTDPTVNGLVVVAPKGQAGQLLLGLNLEPAGYGSQATSGTAFKGSGQVQNNAANGGAIIQLSNPVGSGIVATISKADIVSSIGENAFGVYVAPDLGPGIANDNDINGAAIQPASSALLAAGVVPKCVFRLFRNGATSVGGFGIPGTAFTNIIGGDGASHGRFVINPAGNRITLGPGYGLVARSRTNSNTVHTLNVEFSEQ